MSTVLLISIVLRVAAMIWSILLLKRLRDWRMGVLTAMLALMATRQSMTLYAQTQYSPDYPFFAGTVTELPGLAVSVLAVAVVAFLARFMAEQAAAAAALRNRHGWLELLLDQMPAHILWTTDKKLRYTSMRGAGMKRLGLMEANILGLHPKDYFQTEDLSIAPIAAQQRAVDGEGSTWTFEWLGRIYEGRTEPLRDERGKIIGAIGLAADVSVQRTTEDVHRRTEQQDRHIQGLETIGTLAGGIAHDFNNLLAAMTGYTQLAMADIPSGGRAHSNLNEVLTAARRSEALVDHILAFSRTADEQATVISAADIATEALRLLRASVPPSISISKRLTTDSDSVLINGTRLHQVIVNLCTNAVYAMRESGGELRVTLDTASLGSDSREGDLEPGDYVRLSVRDTGSGIPSEIQHRIFDPFFTTKDIGEGTGMGLAVVHGIVSANGGAIRVDSEIGKGSTFEVLFPLVDADEVDREAEAPAALLGNGERILFVDDEEAIARMGGKMLSALGYEATTSTSGEEALQFTRANGSRFDAVISDVMMPVMRGEVLAREILRLQPDLPIILCSGYGDTDSSEKALALGARRFLKKPVSMQSLAAALRAVLRDHEDTVGDL